MPDPAYDPDTLDEYNKPTIKGYCQQYGLNATGTKQELLERLAESPTTPWTEEDVFSDAGGEAA